MEKVVGFLGTFVARRQAGPASRSSPIAPWILHGRLSQASLLWKAHAGRRFTVESRGADKREGAKPWQKQS